MAAGLVLVAAFGLGFTKLEDADGWTHLALGRDLVQRGAFPAHEPLVFPSLAMPYWNPEWLFGVLLYLSYAAVGPAGVIVLKALIVTLLVSILWREAGLTGDPRPDRALHLAIRVAVFGAILVMIRHRFVERPDLLLALFLSFSVYALNAYVKEGRPYLYALPAAQVLWANLHPSAGVGLVPFAAVLGGALVARAARGRRGLRLPGALSAAQVRTIALVFAGVLVASVVNPYGTVSLTLPVRLAGLTWQTQEVVELQPPRFADTPAPFVVIALLALAFLLVARRLPVADVLLVAPFAILALSAVRFVFLLGVVAAPVVARNVALILDRGGGGWPRRLGLAAATAAAGAGAAVVALSIGGVGPFGDPRKEPGIGVNDRFLPEGALRYLDRHGIEGRVFNTFHWGGYIAWRDFARRVAIVDGRAYLPSGLAEEIHFARVYPQHLDRLQAAYRFDVAVVDYAAYAGDGAEELARAGIDLGLASPRWALVYWDDVAMVYLRRTERFAALIARDHYREVKPANGWPAVRRLLADRSRGPRVVAELERNIAETGSSLGRVLRGFAALELGDLDRALDEFGRVRDDRRRLDAYQGLALAWWQRADWARAIAYFEKIRAVQETGALLHDLGLAYAKVGDDRQAVRYLERARERDPMLAAVYPVLVAAYRRLGDPERERALGPAFRRALVHERVEHHLQEARRLERQRTEGHALAELRAALALSPTDPRALSALGDLHLSAGRLEAAIAAQRAALEADARFARAHYSLALAYAQRGDEDAARTHFAAYVRREPRSYEAWRGREALARESGRPPRR